MSIDWFTVGAQLVNFAVLFFLLSKFLYRPILDAVDRREAKITGRLEEAERIEEEAEKRRRHFEDLQEDLEERRDEMLDEARREAEEWKSSALEEMRGEVREARKHWYGRLRAEQRQFLDEFSRRVESQVFGIARDALRELADESIEATIVDRFLDRLGEVGTGEYESLRGALREGDDPVRVRASFQLGDQRREEIASALEEAAAREVGIEWEVEPELVAGLEVRVGGERYGWSIRSHLDSLRREVDDALSEAAYREKTAEAGGEQLAFGDVSERSERR